MAADIKFHSSTDLQYALEILDDEENIKVLAGGTDFLVDMKEEEDFLAGCSGILDLTDIEELKGIEQRDDHVEIGALVTHRELVRSDIIQEHYPALAQAARTIGSTQIRNRGTIGGNICNAAACADTFGPLVAFEADVELESLAGTRVMPAGEFVEWPYQTKLRDDELLTRFRLPLPEAGTFSSFQKIGRRQAVAITRVSLALAARVEGNVVKDIRVVPGSATPVPQPFSGVESSIRNSRTAALEPEKLGEMAAEEMVEITGERWSTPYKKPALSALVRRAVRALQEEVRADE